MFAVVRRFLAKPLPRRTKKSKKTDKCIVSGYRPKAGVVDQGTTNLVCRRHEFGMGHLRDPAACYLDSTLSEYRRLRPRQKRFLFFLRFSSQDFPVKRDVEKQIFQIGERQVQCPDWSDWGHDRAADL